MVEQRVLVVEDEAAIREMLHLCLSRAGFHVEEAADGQQAQSLVFEHFPDLILLDLMLPGMNGFEFTRQLKKNSRTAHIPIIILTARNDEGDKVRGLEAGADDYVTKPFSPRELIARIKAVLRRAGGTNEGKLLQVGDLCLDLNEHRVSAKGQIITMGLTEFRLLWFFMQHPERVYSRSQVLDYVWGGNTYVDERTVDVHILRLRKALTQFGYAHVIKTVRGVGYRFTTRENYV